jgi:hypothetical protein
MRAGLSVGGASSLSQSWHGGNFADHGVLNKDVTVWLDGARPPLLVLALPENKFDEVINQQSWSMHHKVWVFNSKLDPFAP